MLPFALVVILIIAAGGYRLAVDAAFDRLHDDLDALFYESFGHGALGADLWGAAQERLVAFMNRPTLARYRAAKTAIKHARFCLSLDSAERKAS
jgi:hypothetical protein